MKKILSIFPVLLIVFGLLTVYADAPTAEYNLFKDLGFLPESITVDKLEDAATREDFAFIASKLMKLGNVPRKDTAFDDVKSGNPYSGYISAMLDLGIMEPVSENEFYPEGPAKLNDAYMAALEMLGYKGMRNDTELANSLVIRHNLHRGVTAFGKSGVTNSGLIRLFYNVIESEMPEYRLANGTEQYELSQKRYYLRNSLNYSVYHGEIIEVFGKDRSVRMTVSGNKYNYNYNPLKAGTVSTFSVSEGLDPYKFLHAPVTVWVNSDDVIVSVDFGKNTEVKYACVYSVNSDDNKEHAYSADYIDEIVLSGDDEVYTASNDMKLYYNFSKTSKPVNIIGNFARIVIHKGEITSMDVYDLAEGGIIRSITDNSIGYTRGAVSIARLNDIGLYDERFVYIDGKYCDISELKTDSVFYYYSNDDYLVLVATEKKVTDVLHDVGVGKTTLDIGNITYTADKVYFSTDSKTFGLNVDFSHLLNKTVDAYFTPFGDCLYVQPSNGGSIASGKRLGLLVAAKTDAFDETTVKILFLEPSVETRTYALSNKVKTEDGLVLSEILNNVNTVNGELVLDYVIKNDKIVSISKPKHFEGFAESFPIALFPDNAGFSQICEADLYGTIQTIYLGDSRITFLVEDDGELTARDVEWRKLYGADTTGCMAQVFGYEGNSDVRLALICGNTAKISPKDSYYGLALSKMNVVDGDGNPSIKLKILEQSGATVSYQIPEDEGKNLPGTFFVQYVVGGVTRESDEMMIQNYVDLTGDITNMSGAGMLVGTITAIDDKRIFFDTGRVFYINEKCTYYDRVGYPGNFRFTVMDSGELNVGDTVAYYRYVHGILCVIRVH